MSIQSSDSVSVVELLLQMPDPVIAEILRDEIFTERVGIDVETSISLAEGAKFSQAHFFRVTRNLFLNDAESQEICDVNGSKWCLRFENHNKKRFPVLENGSATYRLDDLLVFASDAQERLEWAMDNFARYNLPTDNSSFWLERLRASSLTDSEWHQLRDDISHTPLNVAAGIRASFTRGGPIDIDALVPVDQTYYENLIGCKCTPLSFEEYRDDFLPCHMEKMLDLRTAARLKLVSLLLAHSSLSECVDLQNQVSYEDVDEFFTWVRERGDRFSQIGAIEIGFNNLERFPSLENDLTELISKFLNDDPADREGLLHLASSLFVLTNGRVASTGALHEAQPYWHRLSSWAQAALIAREIINAGISVTSFSEWASQQTASDFYLRGLLDLRSEPRWLSEFISPPQLKLEFLGRIANISAFHKEKISSDELKELLWGEGRTSVKSTILSSLASCLPGPLEGGTPAISPLPEEILDDIHSALSAEEITVASFTSMVNGAMLFNVDGEIASLAAAALKTAKYSFDDIKNSHSFNAFLVGIARCAAITRSPNLADELRILCRVERRRKTGRISPEDEFQIAMIAGASEAEFDLWASRVSEWLEEVSNEVASKDSGVYLRRCIQRICQFEPKLRRYCGRAIALLKGYTEGC